MENIPRAEKPHDKSYSSLCERLRSGHPLDQVRHDAAGAIERLMRERNELLQKLADSLNT